MILLGECILLAFLFQAEIQEADFSILTVEPNVHYAEAKDQNESGEIVAPFSLTNSGTNTIHILSVHPHCSCTEFNLSNFEIKKGSSESLTLTVPWDQLKNLGEIYAVLKTDSNQKFTKVSIKLVNND